MAHTCMSNLDYDFIPSEIIYIKINEIKIFLYRELQLTLIEKKIKIK